MLTAPALKTVFLQAFGELDLSGIEEVKEDMMAEMCVRLVMHGSANPHVAQLERIGMLIERYNWGTRHKYWAATSLAYNVLNS